MPKYNFKYESKSISHHKITKVLNGINYYNILQNSLLISIL